MEYFKILIKRIIIFDKHEKYKIGETRAYK